MAAFRVITAEEEAASGLMHCLKEIGYLNAEKLKPRDHIHKNAITPFLDVLGLSFHQMLNAHSAEPVFHIKEIDGTCRLTSFLKMQVEGEEKWLYPTPPLNFSMSCDGRPLSYRKEIESYLAHRGATDIEAHLKERANVRNTLLYAGPKGYPADIILAPDFFAARTVRVLALLRAYLLIQPYQQQLPFVQDAVDAFLFMLGRLPAERLHDEV